MVSYGEYAERKKEGSLISEEDQKERIEFSKYEFNEAEYKNKLKQNDIAVYEMYNKFHFLQEELDMYKDKLIERIADFEPEAEGEGDQPEPILQKPIEEMTQEEKDYQLYILAKELKLTKWNNDLQSAVNILKKNNVQNNAHIREQKQLIDALFLRLGATEDNSRSFREALKDFKMKTENTLKEVPRKGPLQEVMINGELNVLNDIVIKMTKHIKDKLESSFGELLDNQGPNKEEMAKMEESIRETSKKLNGLILEVGDKADRKFMEAELKDLREAIKNVKNKAQVKISSMKQLADDDTLRSIFEELIDGRYNEYEKSIAKIHGRMDTIGGDIER